ncbi:MAG: hypothetical protein LC793_10325 [Thermomicrobia bacterium]|nr:hypothetical protein [Thermomicrobia bacterium]MCA1725449.1 hypothetical protein [Thermomicrobia bacterium]
MKHATPLSRWLILTRAEIDAAFGAMATDTAHQTEARMIAAEFSRADWETFHLNEDADTS